MGRHRAQPVRQFTQRQAGGKDPPNGFGRLKPNEGLSQRQVTDVTLLPGLRHQSSLTIVANASAYCLTHFLIVQTYPLKQ